MPARALRLSRSRLAPRSRRPHSMLHGQRQPPSIHAMARPIPPAQAVYQARAACSTSINLTTSSSNTRVPFSHNVLIMCL
eukprot:scaffold5731_cov119-Isochrysis_galbana.AAC.7